MTPGAADGRPYGMDSRLISDIGEGAVAIVMEQAVLGLGVKQAAQIAGDEQVEKTVAIVISPCGAEHRTPARHAGLFRNIGERAVPVVPPQFSLAPVETEQGAKH